MIKEERGGFTFHYLEEVVTYSVSWDLEKSFGYWYNLVGMKVYEKDEKKQRTLLGSADNQCKLEL